MKKGDYIRKSWRMIDFILGCALVVFIAGAESLLAQETRISKSDVPDEVVERIESDFMSCVENITWFTSNGEDADYYILNAKGKNMSCEAVYTKEGELVYAITTRSNVAIPQQVREYIADEYDGWEITGDKQQIRNFDENLSYMEVQIEKDGESQKIYFDSNGEEISQQMALYTEKQEVRKRDIPSSVSETIESDFLSCKDNITWYRYDRTTSPGRYVLTATGTNTSCRAVYDRRGNLISSETVSRNVKLPPDVMRFIMTEYPDWTVTEDKSTITNFDEATRFYEVTIEKGDEKKVLYFNSKGETVDEPAVIGS